METGKAPPPLHTTHPPTEGKEEEEFHSLSPPPPPPPPPPIHSYSHSHCLQVKTHESTRTQLSQQLKPNTPTTQMSLTPQSTIHGTDSTQFSPSSSLFSPILPFFPLHPFPFLFSSLLFISPFLHSLRNSTFSLHFSFVDEE